MIRVKKYHSNKYVCEIRINNYHYCHIYNEDNFRLLNFVENDLPLEKMKILFKKNTDLANIQIYQIDKSKGFISIFVSSDKKDKLIDDLQNNGINLNNKRNTIKINLYGLKSYELPNDKLYFYGYINI